MSQSAPIGNSWAIESPLGPCAVFFQAEPFRILRIALPGPCSPKRCAPDKTVDLPSPLLQVIEMLQGYFKGKPIDAPPWQWLYTGDLTKLERAVLEATARIPYASLRSYQDIAHAVGRPKAYRFVGSALGKNPFPILIPCHRVIRSNGDIGGFSAGADLKQKLIALEAGFRSLAG